MRRGSQANADLGARADVLVVDDTAGFGNQAAATGDRCADAVIVPMLAGRANIAEATRTVRLHPRARRAAETRRPCSRPPETR